ncbi:MAG TPA: rod shape-determining protein MreC [bacterium]|nr:rod shape-determining protein MreC [bacterium]
MFLDTVVRRRRFVVFAMLCILALGVLTDQVRSPDKRRIGWIGVAVEAAVAPLATGLSRISDVVDREWAFVAEIGRLRTENARLTAEVARLREENARLHEAGLEVARLRSLVGIKDQPYHTVAARVIGRDPSHWFNSLLVDRGTADGVRRNDPVITSDGLVGRVIEASGTWARVLLILDPRSAAGVLVGRSRDAGVAEGQGQPVLHVKYLSRDAEILPGDQVVTAGLGEIYPRGLPVGTVVGVSRTEGDLFQEALVRPGADLNHLEEMLILVGGGSQAAP